MREAAGDGQTGGQIEMERGEEGEIEREGEKMGDQYKKVEGKEGEMERKKRERGPGGREREEKELLKR